jgi:hypothetical protein
MDPVEVPTRQARTWRVAVLSAVFGAVALVAVPMGAVGFLVDILSHMDTPDPEDRVWVVFAVIFFVGFACGIAAFALGLLGLVRGPRGPRVLAGIGLGLALLPVIAVVGLLASTIAGIPS